MKRDFSKNYQNWIKGLTQEQFDGFCKIYTEIEWALDHATLSSGPNDGGIDLRFFENNARIKIPIQITTQETLKNKLEKDLSNIVELIQKENYSNEFYFMYSRVISDTEIRRLQREAKGKYGINLIILDASEFASIIQQPEFSKLRVYIKDVLGELLDDEEEYFDDFEKLKFDLIAYGNETLEIKSRIVQSYIMFVLFENENMERTKLARKLSSKFKMEVEYCKRQIDSLLSTRKINRISKDILALNREEKERIETIKQGIEIQAKSFSQSFREVIDEYKILDNEGGLIKQVLKLYTENYNNDINEINEEFKDDDLIKMNSFIQFENYLKRKIYNKAYTKAAAKKIIFICKQNDYLQRIAAGNTFYSIIKSNNFQSYYNRQPKSIFLDTPLLLYLFCVYYDDQNIDYRVPYYKVAKDFMKYQINGEVKLSVNVLSTYIQEVAFQFLNASKLSVLSSLPILKKLGKTTNVFYNFFNFLKNEEYFDDDDFTFSEFLNAYGFGDEIRGDGRQLEFIEAQLTHILQVNGINVMEPNFYRDFKKRSRFTEIKKDLEIIHMYDKEYRTPISIEHDATMASILYDDEIEFIDPTFLTWDNSFYKLRNEYNKSHPQLRFWYLFRPGKYIDHLSLIHFHIDNDVLTDDMLSIMEMDFDLHGRVKFLSEAIVRIVDVKSSSGLKLASGITEIRERYLNQQVKPEKEITEKDFETVQPIDEFIIMVSQYYISKKGKYNLDDFKMAVNNVMYVDTVLQYLSLELEHYLRTAKFSDTYPTKFDELIMKDKTAKKE